MAAKHTWFSAKLVDGSNEETADIAIYDVIGSWGVGAADFRDALASLGKKVKVINLHVNSPGGEVFDSVAISNMLKSHPARVVATIDGIAASASTIVTSAADEVRIPENAMMMVHDPMSGVFGNADDMRDFADVVDKIKAGMVATYTAKTKQTPDIISAMLSKETWMTAAEAKNMGFADTIIPAISISNRFDLSKYKIAPVALHKPATAATEKWAVGAARDLPVLEKDGWDGPAAAEAMLDAAGFNGNTPKPDEAKTGFLIYDGGNPTLKGSYKLPFADMIDGKKTAISGGITAASQRLSQTDAPTDIIDGAKGVIEAYQAKLKGDGEGGGTTNVVKLPASGSADYALEIANMCKLAGFPAMASDFIINKVSLTDARAKLIDARAAKDQEVGELMTQQPGKKTTATAGPSAEVMATWDTAFSAARGMTQQTGQRK